MGKSIFTEEQTKYILDNYEELSTEEIADKLGFTVDQIIGKANYLGLKKRTTFTKEQDEYIVDNYPTINTKDIADKLGFTIKQINTRAKNLGIYKISNKKHIIIDGKQTRIEDCTGEKYGRLTITSFDGERYKQDLTRYKSKEITTVVTYWFCECDCGNKPDYSFSIRNLKSGHTTSCGCYNLECIKERKDENLIGLKFNHLTVISRNEEREKEEFNKFGRWQKYWNCKCDCGSDKIVVVSTGTIKGGATQSCGCIMGDKIRESHKKRALQGNSIMHFLINKYGKKTALEMVDNEYNKQFNLYEINKGNSGIYIHINCLNKKYHGEFEVTPCHLSDKKKPTGCPYCSNAQGRVHPLDSLGALDENVHSVWSDKNKKSPYEYSINSTRSVWWKCSEGIHEDYKRKISDYRRAKYSCLYCGLERIESMLQKKVRLYLTKELGYTLKHEWDCSIVPRNPRVKVGNYTLPFDNEVVELKLIIEVHGSQHYEACSLNSLWKDKTGLSPEKALHKRKLYDRYKKYCAYKAGYHYLAIPYWTEDDESYKELINNKINEIIHK